MSLVIQDSELTQLNMTARELRLELAVFLYEKGKVTSGRAAEFASMQKLQFLEELAPRQIPVQYDEDDLQEDIDTLDI